MRKPATDPIREDRIHNEAIVDAYGPEEKAMSWYYYLENKVRFPFQARCIVANLASPIKKGKTVEVAPLSQVAHVDPDESTAEAIGDWHYWVARGYLF